MVLALMCAFGLWLLPAAVVLAAHPDVPLYDAAGQPIAFTPGVPAPAYSSFQSCSCHSYDKIENHSFHAQLGANEQFGWDAWNPDSSEPFLAGDETRGKGWVQSPGHVGKW
ncbi:MAG: cytochrome c [Geothermobacteraceae bacterium]